MKSLIANYKKKPLEYKRVPQRSCIGCRQIKAKRELIRLVATGTGVVEIDLSGKKAGRGGYLCPQVECWEAALKKDRLEHALRTKLSQESRQMFLEHVHQLIGGVRRES